MHTILVTGVGGPAGMATIQSLRIAPEQYRLVGVDMDPLAPGLFDSDERAVVPPSSSPGYIPSLLRLSSRFGVEVIVPTVDEEVSVLARNLDRFKSRGIGLPISSAESVDLSRDKLRMAEFDWRGVLVPKTVSFDSASELNRIVSQVGLPCVLKQRVGRGGRGFAVIETVADARYWMRKSKTKSLILQEKVEGDLLLAQGLAHKGRLLRAIVHRRLAVKAAGSGTATAAVTLKNDGVVADLRTVVRLLHWEGALGIEFIHDRVSRKNYMIDINPRICGQSHLSTMAGMNLAYGLVQLALGDRVSVDTSYKTGLAFIRSWKDVAVDYDETTS